MANKTHDQNTTSNPAMRSDCPVVMRGYGQHAQRLLDDLCAYHDAHGKYPESISMREDMFYRARKQSGYKSLPVRSARAMGVPIVIALQVEGWLLHDA